MKKCTWCGRENNEDARHCSGCGTNEFVSSVNSPTVQGEAISKASKRGWLSHFIQCANVDLGELFGKGSETTGKARHGGTGRLFRIAGVTIVATIAVIMFPILRDYIRRSVMPEESYKPSSSSGSNLKSARQLLRERAVALYPRNDRIEIDGGYYGGAYQVTVWVDFRVIVYAAEVDERAQTITAWELKH